jgi:transcriptional regulator with XRE-family HTH domain
MSMTPAQAKKLGQLIARTREARGIGMRELALMVGVSLGWISEFEAGRYLDTSPGRLARIAEALNLDPTRLDRFTGGTMANSLPNLKTYFRAKYDLTPEQIAQVEQYVRRLRRAA